MLYYTKSERKQKNNMPTNNNQYEKAVIKELDGISELLRDLFILEATKAGVPNKDIREILGIDLNRVTRISKHIKSSKNK